MMMMMKDVQRRETGFFHEKDASMGEAKNVGRWLEKGQATSEITPFASSLDRPTTWLLCFF